MSILLKRFELILILLLVAGVAHTQTDCVAPAALERKSFSFTPPVWDTIGKDQWENAEHSAQIQFTTHPLRPGVDIKKYAQEFPQNLKAAEVEILKQKEMKVGASDAFLMEGKQRIGKEISKIKSVSIFGKETLYYFTLIANDKAFTKAKSCFDAVVATLIQKN